MTGANILYKEGNLLEGTDKWELEKLDNKIKTKKMTKFLTLEPKKNKKEERKTIFTRYLGEDRQIGQVPDSISIPSNWDNCLFIGTSKEYGGDVFKCWDNGKELEFEIYFGKKGDEFDNENTYDIEKENKEIYNLKEYIHELREEIALNQELHNSTRLENHKKHCEFFEYTSLVDDNIKKVIDVLENLENISRSNYEKINNVINKLKETNSSEWNKKQFKKSLGII
jgi:hypothetical protein